MHIPDNHPLLLTNLAQKEVTSTDGYFNATVRELPGYANRGTPWPFNQHKGVQSFESWVYRAAMLRAKGVAKVPLRQYVKVEKGTRTIASFRSRYAWRKAVYERIEAHNGNIYEAAEDDIMLFTTRKVSRKQRDWLAGERQINGQSISPGPVICSKVANFGSDYEEVTETHPALSVLRTVNPWMNGFELTILRMLYLYLTGNAYLLPIMTNGVPTEVWPLPSQFTHVIPSTTNWIDGYAYGKDIQSGQIFGRDDVIQFKLPNPGNPFYGKGCVEAAWTALGLHNDKRIMDTAKFRNMARPDWLLFVKGAVGPALQTVEDKINQSLRGTQNTGRVLAVAGDGVTAQALNLPIEEIGDSDRILEEIANGFEVPVSMFLGNDPIKANSETMVNSFLRDTVLPDTILDSEKLNEKWLPLFPDAENMVLAYDSPLLEDQEFQLKKAIQGRQNKVLTGDEVRQEWGYDPIEGGDEIEWSGAKPGTEPAPPQPPPAPSAPVKTLPDVIVNVTMPEIEVKAPIINVTNEQPAAVVVPAPEVNIAETVVNVSAPTVTVEAAPSKNIRKMFKRDKKGLITEVSEEEVDKTEEVH